MYRKERCKDRFSPVTRQWAQTGTQEVLSEYQRKCFCWDGDEALPRTLVDLHP